MEDLKCNTNTQEMLNNTRMQLPTNQPHFSYAKNCTRPTTGAFEYQQPENKTSAWFPFWSAVRPSRSCATYLLEAWRIGHKPYTKVLHNSTFNVIYLDFSQSFNKSPIEYCYTNYNTTVLKCHL